MRESKLLRQLGSARLALWLIGIYIVMNVLSFVIPQKSTLSTSYPQFLADYPLVAKGAAALGLDHIFTSWLMLVVTALLVINLIACTMRRLIVRRRVGRPAVGRSAAGATLGPAWANGESYLEAADERIRLAKYNVVARDEGGLLGRTGDIGFWGSMLFHASLLVLIVGGAATGLTTFKGRLVITEGQEVVDEAAAYERIETVPRIGKAFTGGTIGLDEMQFAYQGDVVVGAVAKMHFLDQRGRVGTGAVRVNYPLEAGGRSYLLLRTGYAVNAAIGVQGQPAQSRVIRLGQQSPDGWRDIFELPPVNGKPALLQLRATPVPLPKGQPMPARQFEIKDPRLYVVLVVDDKPVKRVELQRGETADIGNGVTIEFNDVVFWTFYRVTGEPMRWITYTGFWLAVLGAAIRFAVPERRLALVVAPGDSGDREVRAQVRSRPWSGLAAGADERLVNDLLTLASRGPAGADDGADDVDD